MKLFNSIMKRAIDRDTAQNLGFNRIMIAQFNALKVGTLSLIHANWFYFFKSGLSIKIKSTLSSF